LREVRAGWAAVRGLRVVIEPAQEIYAL
jgi:hypothetical protein